MDYNNDSGEENENEEITTAGEVVRNLEQAWINEKLAPELLQYEEELVECLLDQIQHMESSLQKIKKEDFRIVFHKMELDRIKYVLSSYLRTRLEKVEKFAAYMLHQEESQGESNNRMSAEERSFAQNYVHSIKNYLHSTALKNMPSNMQSMKFEDMGSKPNMDYSVFIKVKKDVRGVVVEESGDFGEEEIIDLTKGSQHVLRYRPIASLIKDGSVHLI